MVLLTACTDAECVTEGCVPLAQDGGADAAGDSGARDADVGDGGVDAGPTCTQWLPVEGCGDDAECLASVTLGLTTVGSAVSPETMALESVSFIPGSDDRALAMSAEHILVEVFYGPDGVRFDRLRNLPVDFSTQYATSVKVHPSGEWAAVAIADVDCAPGEVLLVGIGDDDFASVLQRVEVGFVPDNLELSEDGDWLITADEDERSNRPCKPDDRNGGSVTVVDVSGGPGAAAVAQTLVVDHAVNSEPESVNVGSAGTVVVTLQETSELMFFSLADVPSATATIVALPSGGEPDGVAVSDELGLAVAGLERSDDVVLVDLAAEAVVDRVDLVVSGDVPDRYNRDEGDSIEIHEPEQIEMIDHRGVTFAVFPLQESHVLMAYRVSPEGTLALDSTAPSGLGWMDELDGTGRSRIGPEGIAVRADVGLFLVANEREGTLTLFKSADATHGPCP